MITKKDTQRVEFLCEKDLYNNFRAIVKNKTGSDRKVSETLRTLMRNYIRREANKLERQKYRKETKKHMKVVLNWLTGSADSV